MHTPIKHAHIAINVLNMELAKLAHLADRSI